jgi:hypothetical protein
MKLGEQPGGTGEIPADLLPAFVKTYGKDVKTCIDSQRNYKISAFKENWYKWWKKNNKTLPTVDEVLQCALRSSKDLELGSFYHQTLVKTAVGMQNWPDRLARWFCMSNIKHKNDPTFMVCNSIMEAFIVIMFESNRTKWLNMFVKSENHKGPEPIQWRYQGQPEEERKMYTSLYTDQNSGQQQWGGLNDAGVKRFNKVVQQIEDSRTKLTKEQIHAWEHEVLVKVQEKNKVVARSSKEQRKLARNRKRHGDAVACAPPKRARIAVDFSDDEGDEKE